MKHNVIFPYPFFLSLPAAKTTAPIHF